MFNKRLIATLTLIATIVSLVVAFAIQTVAATEQEVLETIYQLDEMEMYQPHNNYSFKMWKSEYAAINDFSQIEDAVYIECDVFGNLDTYQAPDTSLAIIAKNFLHPSNSYQPVLVWTAPYDGKIEVNSKYSCPKNGGTAIEDPTEMFIYFNEDVQHQQITSQEEVENVLSLDVKAGDQVMWTINNCTDMTNDTTMLLTRVWYTEVDVNSGVQVPDTSDTETPDTPDTKDTTDTTATPTTPTPTTDAPDTTPTTNNGAAETPADGLPVGAIIGIVAAVVVVVVVVIVIVKKKKA